MQQLRGSPLLSALEHRTVSASRPPVLLAFVLGWSPPRLTSAHPTLQPEGGLPAPQRPLAQLVAVTAEPSDVYQRACSAFSLLWHRRVLKGPRWFSFSWATGSPLLSGFLLLGCGVPSPSGFLTLGGQVPGLEQLGPLLVVSPEGRDGRATLAVGRDPPNWPSFLLGCRARPHSPGNSGQAPEIHLSEDSMVLPAWPPL